MAEIDVTRIAGNIGAMNALNALKGINKQLAIHQTRLSSGKRINTAADDPAGLSIATKMLSRSEGLKVALSNIGDAKNLLAVAESGMGRINDILVQMRNKAETGASDTMGDEERVAIKTQLDAYAAQIDDIAKQTKWNNTVLLDGSMTTMRLQTGVDSSDATSLDNLGNMKVTGSVLNIATSATGNEADTTTAGFTDFAVADGVAAFNGINALETGSYKVVYNYDFDSGTPGNSKLTVHLFDANGNAMAVDKDGADAVSPLTNDTTSEALEFTWDSTGATKQVNLGNGLQLTFKQALADTGGDKVETVSFTKTGDTILKLGAGKAADYAGFMDTIQAAINSVNQKMSSLGALTGRLTFKEDQVSASQINIEAAYNRIMNADMAEEQVEASKYQILQRTATAMLAQANAAPQFLLTLFQ